MAKKLQLLGEIVDITAREKIAAIEQALAGSGSSSGSDSGSGSGSIEVIVTDGQFYGATGSVASHANYESATVDVSNLAGTTLTITAYATLATRCLFVDTDGGVIEAWTQEEEPVKKVVPDGAAKLLISNDKSKGSISVTSDDMSSGSDSGSGSGSSSGSDSSNTDLTALRVSIDACEEQIADHETRILVLESGEGTAESLADKVDKIDVFGGVVNVKLTTEADYYYPQSGVKTPNTNGWVAATADVSALIGVTLIIDTYAIAGGYCHFFDADGASIEAWSQSSTTNKVVPEGAVILALSNSSSGKIDESVTYTVTDSIDDRVTELEEKHIENKMKISLKPYKVSFNGDSITEGLLSQGKYSYVPFVVENLMIGAHENNGKSGQSIGVIRTTAEKTTDADIITVFAGTNNLSESMDISTIKNDFVGMYETFKTNNTDHANKLFLLITPVKRFDVEESLALRLEEIVDMIVEVGKEQKIPVLDMWHFSGIEKDNETKYFVDHIHPNEAGARYLAGIISDYISRCLLIKTMHG